MYALNDYNEKQVLVNMDHVACIETTEHLCREAILIRFSDGREMHIPKDMNTFFADAVENGDVDTGNDDIVRMLDAIGFALRRRPHTSFDEIMEKLDKIMKKLEEK